MSATDASNQANRAGMDPKRLVVIGYLSLGIIFALFLSHILGSFVGGYFKNTDLIEGTPSKPTDVAAVLLTLGLAFWLWTNASTKAISLDVASELMKVTWPSWEETRISTFAVVIASLVAAVILFGIDTVAYKLMVDWLPAVWGKL